MTIDEMIETTIGHEGGYSNHPNDPGGETMWGITVRVARKWGYLGNMSSLPRELAVHIYRQEYLVGPGFDKVAEVFPKVGMECFDTGVNMGQSWPALWLQSCLNAFNDGARLYADIKEDGDIGPGTIAALRAYKSKRGAEAESVMVKALNCLQGARYLELAKRRAANESFEFGWFRTRIG